MNDCTSDILLLALLCLIAGGLTASLYYEFRKHRGRKWLARNCVIKDEGGRR